MVYLLIAIIDMTMDLYVVFDKLSKLLNDTDKQLIEHNITQWKHCERTRLTNCQGLPLTVKELTIQSRKKMKNSSNVKE